MIGEVPAPYCVTSRSDQYQQLRASVDRLGHHHATRQWWWLDYRGKKPPTITVSGIGFFDRIHRTDGQAPNGVELHPVLRIAP